MAVQDLIDLDGLKAFTYRLKTVIVTKQDALTFDDTPTADSTNPVTSGGVKAAIDAIQLHEYPVNYTEEIPTEGTIDNKIYGVGTDTNYAFYIGNKDEQLLVQVTKYSEYTSLATRVESLADMLSVVDNTVESFEESFTTKNLTVQQNARINGNLYVDGITISQETQQTTTTSNYIITRNNVATALAEGEFSGLVVATCAVGKIATLVVDSEGTWRISAGATSSSTTFNNISVYKSTFYEGLTHTVETGISTTDLFTGVDGDALASVGWYETTDTYYQNKDDSWYIISVNSENKLVVGSTAITDQTIIDALEAGGVDTLTYFRSITKNVIDNSTSQAILTRAEEEDLVDGAALKWDAATKKAISGNFKTTQTAKSSPTASGNTLAFIDTISQNTNGEITATKKSVTIDSTLSSTSTNPVQNKAVYTAIEEAKGSTNVAVAKTGSVTTTNSSNAYSASLSGFTLKKGALITVHINANSTDVATLNIASSGAKTVYLNGAVTSSSNKLYAGEYYNAYYNGSYWYLTNADLPLNVPTATTSVAGRVQLTSSYVSTDMSKAITGAAVEAALNTLDVTDTAVSGQYVSAVSETNGKINVTRASLPSSGTSASTIGSASGQAFGSNSGGSATTYSKSDHTHQVQIAVSAASSVGSTSGQTFGSNAEGSSTSLARSDHTHQVRLPVFTGTSGTPAVGLVPAPATTDTGKFLSSSGSWESIAASITIETCSTAAATAAKTTSSAITKGLAVITFSNTNTAAAPKLNGKAVKAFGTTLTSDNAGLLSGTCVFVLDGTSAHLISSGSGSMWFNNILLGV